MLACSMLLHSRLLATAALLCSATLCHGQNATELAPGVPWPQLGVVITADSDISASKAIVVHSSEVKFNSHAGGNFARSVVYAGPKSGVEVKGEHAATMLRNASPTLYVRLSSDDPDTQRRRITLLRLQPVKDGREVVQFTSNIFGGSRKRVEESIPVTKQDVEGSTWVKVVPEKPLESGEYAIAFVPTVVVSFPDQIYDFTVAMPK